jgi:hypothetical protein
VILPAAAAACLAHAAGAAGAAGSPHRPHGGRSAATCQIAGVEASLGPTYVSYLQAGGGASCAEAERVVGSLYRCRVRHGGVSGHCQEPVEGFTCEEYRYSVVTVQYDSHVICLRGRARVRYTYTQIT